MTKQLGRISEERRRGEGKDGRMKKRMERRKCGRRHSERYDNTGLFTVTYQLIYRGCTCTEKGSWSTSASLTVD